jgi:hypothetical protein
VEKPISKRLVSISKMLQLYMKSCKGDKTITKNQKEEATPQEKAESKRQLKTSAAGQKRTG